MKRKNAKGNDVNANNEQDAKQNEE